MDTVLRALMWRGLPLARVLILAFAMAAAVGCETTRHLRDAQESFSEAAALENLSRLGDAPGAAPTPDGGSDASFDPQNRSLIDGTLERATVRGHYAAALASLDQILPSQATALRKDGLLGTALTLKAFTLWRLDQHELALKAAEEAAVESEQIHDRDRALIKALPALIRIDIVHADIARAIAEPPDVAGRQAVVDTVRRLVEGALDDLNAARQSVHPTHPVQLSLVQAQLAALRNLQVAHQRVLDDIDFGPRERTRANEAVAELRRLLAEIGLSDQLAVNWESILGTG